MTTSVQLSFPRAPSRQLQELLKEGYLKPLLSLSKRNIGGCNLDIHFRSNDKVQVYCGRASLISVELKNDDTVIVSANESYKTEKYQGNLYWVLSEDDGSFWQELNNYLDDVPAHHRMMQGEGLIQDRWSCIEYPWVSFDRESGLKYNSAPERDKETSFPIVEEARNKIINIASQNGWEEPTEQLARRQIDRLGIDSEGNLVLGELKVAKGSMYYSPLQLLEYIHEWYNAFKCKLIRLHVGKLIDARRNLGLIPDVPPLTGNIRAAVCFGEDNRSNEVKRRYDIVLGVVNQHLPPGVLRPIETWSLGKLGPQSL